MCAWLQRILEREQSHGLGVASREPLGRTRGGSRGESRKAFIWKSDKEVVETPTRCVSARQE